MTGLRWRLADDDGGQGQLFDDERMLERHVGKGEFRGMEFLHVNARTIINKVPGGGGRLPFSYTINPYRGCSNRCNYCYARPTHEYLGLNIGEDFDRKIVVKVNAVERVRAEVRPGKWGGHPIAMGTNTDPYQRCEGKYHLTRGILGVLSAARNPFSILTKSTLILRDLDLLEEAAARTEVSTALSIGTLDEEVWRHTEPGTPHPRRRIEAVARLNEAGVPCGVLMGPVLPGLSDGRDQLAAVVRAAEEAGATSISAVPLHLKAGVREHFLAALEAWRPDLVPTYLALFAQGSYQPAAARAALTTVVGELRR
ncbi:MAG TPA: radical SAM protein [Acidimicrobiales bacterium]|nr:radical SAM protein [Acidimicrobiales bacterium]